MHQVADAIDLGPACPTAVQVGGRSVYLVAPSDRRRRHEQQHLVQAAQYAPSWARWLPVRLRAWLGAAEWAAEYLRLLAEHGYVNHPFERDARDAEEPTVPGVRPPRGPLLGT